MLQGFLFFIGPTGPNQFFRKEGIEAGRKRSVPEVMATAWVCRNSGEEDLLKLAFFTIEQAIAERAARKWKLKVSWHIANNYADMAVQGELGQIADFVKELADLYGIGGLAVDLEEDEQDNLNSVNEIEVGACNRLIFT